MEPQFTHDCDWCIFIGRVERGEGEWKQSGWRYEPTVRTITWPAGDLWVHPSGGVIVRTGSDGPDYHSMDDAYLAALPPEWQPMARSIWRHYNKEPTEYDRERMRERRRERRQDRRVKRRGGDPFYERMMKHPLPTLPNMED